MRTKTEKKIVKAMGTGMVIVGRPLSWVQVHGWIQRRKQVDFEWLNVEDERYKQLYAEVVDTLFGLGEGWIHPEDLVEAARRKSKNDALKGVKYFEGEELIEAKKIINDFTNTKNENND